MTDALHRRRPHTGRGYSVTHAHARNATHRTPTATDTTSHIDEPPFPGSLPTLPAARCARSEKPASPYTLLTDPTAERGPPARLAWLVAPMERAAAAKPHAPLHTGVSLPPVSRCEGRANLALERPGQPPNRVPTQGRGNRGTPQTDPTANNLRSRSAGATSGRRLRHSRSW